jgi:hypothetical protein
VLFPAQPFIAAGAAIFAGLARVNQIRKTNFEGGSGGGGGAVGGSPISGSGGGGGGASTIPQFNGAPNPNLFNLRPDQQAVRSYVLAGDVASSVEARQKIKDRTRL